jgi:hypothetical protein
MTKKVTIEINENGTTFKVENMSPYELLGLLDYYKRITFIKYARESEKIATEGTIQTPVE